MKAMVIGATGSTGELLVDKLLADNNYSNVTIFVRRSTGKQHSKLIEQIIDFSNIETYKDLIVGDVIFSCLGTTLKAAGSKENQLKIDFDIPATFAKLARENNVPAFVLLSAYGASSKSKVFYSQIKGKLEDSIAELNFEKYIIFRPGLLVRKGSDRFGENIMVHVLKMVNAIGLFRKFKPMPTSLLAKKLAKAPRVLPNGTSIIELHKIFNFAK
ncbi:NAD(P)H-binding protein [Flavobacterium sp. ANB]|uniref:NAD(P)H-binding protein n=1 Tax=unclassified Flavobacterium TaxID=196869 RepID=UPI0012B9B611|nr:MULTISPECIES: NAD(P)H-binding protein [unclassified Flavobacterium]MBF4516930.1 NAD(P)H-binding protein [Flavobacterium sp. ANB]MTD69174.1 NAD(P)H-binding protein [Flavobacterium sp. LC2016-13]